MRLDWARWKWPLVAALGLAACLAGFFALFEKRTVEVDAPTEGPATRDRYYALRLYLEERGVAVRSTRRWQTPAHADTAVFWFNHEPVPHEVRAWLGEGGQLWAFTDPDGSYEWEPTPWGGGSEHLAEQAQQVVAQSDADEPAQQPGDSNENADADAQTDAVAEPQDADAGQAENEAAGDDCGGDYACWQAQEAARALRYCADDLVPCLYAAQFDYGQGCLTLVEGEALTNQTFTDGVNAARVDALLRCPSYPRAVVFVRGLESPWIGQLLVDHAPEALAAACVLALLWFWRAARHLGPAAPLSVEERRRWMEHVGAVGQLAARSGLDPLLAGAREELHRRLALRLPEAAHLEGDALMSAVGMRLHIPEATVRRALTDPPRGTPAHTLSIARDMLDLWRKL